MDDKELHKLLGPPIIIDESNAIYTCLSCNYATDKLFHDSFCMNCTNDVVGKAMYFKENEEILLEKAVKYFPPIDDELLEFIKKQDLTWNNPIEKQKRLEELEALFSSVKNRTNQNNRNYNHYPDYYQWLTEEFGDDAYVAFWNMD